MGNAAAVGAGSLTLGNGTGTVTLDNTAGGPLSLTNTALTINSDLTFVGTSSLNLGSGTGTLNGDRTVTVSGNTLYVPAALSGSGSLTKAGAGTLTLAAVNPFSNGNGVTVKAGTLNLLAGGGAGTVSGPLTINNGGTVNALAGDAVGYNPGTSVTTLTVNAGGVFNLGVDSSPTLINTGNEGFVTNLVLNGGTVTGVDAAGTQTLARLNFNTGFGITTLASGTTATISSGIQIRGNNTVVPINVASGSTASGTDLAITGSIDQYGAINGAVNKLGGGTLTLSGFSTYTGGTNVAAGTVNLSAGGPNGAVIGPLTVNTGTTVNATVANTLGYNAGGAVTTLTVNGTFNVLTGGDQGYLTNVVLGGGSILATTFANGVANGNLAFNEGNAATPFSLNTSAGSPLSTITTSVSIRNGGTLPINAASDLLITGPVIGGGGSINKSGAGTLTLTDPGADGSGMVGNNTYTGGTTISQGAIRFNEQVAYSGAVPTNFLGTGTTTILPGGTLGGNGTTGGPVVVAGTITGGQDANTIGTVTSGSQSWNGSGSYLVKIASGNDLLVMSGLTINASSGAPFTVNPSFTGTLANGSSYVIATDQNTDVPGAPNPFTAALGSALVLSGNAPSPGTGEQFTLATQADGGGYDLLLDVVGTPEPTSLLLLGLAGTPLALGRRRGTRRNRVAV